MKNAIILFCLIISMNSIQGQSSGDEENTVAITVTIEKSSNGKSGWSTSISVHKFSNETGEYTPVELESSEVVNSANDSLEEIVDKIENETNDILDRLLEEQSSKGKKEQKKKDNDVMANPDGEGDWFGGGLSPIIIFIGEVPVDFSSNYSKDASLIEYKNLDQFKSSFNKDLKMAVEEQ